MSTPSRNLVAVVLVAALTLALSGGADARGRHGHYRGGWYGGFGPGFALGFGFGFGAPYYNPGRYYYPRTYYYGPRYYGPRCRWVRVRVWRGDHWSWRRVRRCW